jgi:hypothetical protein
VEQDALGELVADGEDGVEARHRVLEDDGAALAPEGAHLLVGPLGDVLALVQDAARVILPVSARICMME